MNKIQLIGRLTADPELKSTNNGLQVCSFTVAVNRRFNREETDFFPVTVWREAAVNCSKYLAKGSQVGVCGAVQIRRYEDKDGIKRTAIDIQADEVEFLTSKSESGAASNNVSTPKKTNVAQLEQVDDDEMPF